MSCQIFKLIRFGKDKFKDTILVLKFYDHVYLQRMERQERFEAVLKERETQRMQYQQWSVPDPYGLSLQQ